MLKHGNWSYSVCRWRYSIIIERNDSHSTMEFSIDRGTLSFADQWTSFCLENGSHHVLLDL